MPTFTVISEDGVAAVEATVAGERVLVAPAAVPEALGWEVKPEGLCRGDVCVPVLGRLPADGEGRIDLVAVAALLDRPVLLDGDAGALVVGVRASERREALRGHRLPPFTLPDLDGELHAIEEWHGAKRLLVAFASW